MEKPDYLQPLVVKVDPVVPERMGAIDVYRPVLDHDGPSPVLVFVHGGPVPAQLSPTPRAWPVYVGYGSLAARAGAIGVTVDTDCMTTRSIRPQRPMSRPPSTPLAHWRELIRTG